MISDLAITAARDLKGWRAVCLGDIGEAERAYDKLLTQSKDPTLLEIALLRGIRPAKHYRFRADKEQPLEPKIFRRGK